MSIDAVVFHRQDDRQVVTEFLADGSIAVFDSDRGAVHSLHPSAAAVWKCCAEPVTIARIVRLLQHEGGPSLGADTVASALQELEQAGLVRRAGQEDSLSLQSRRAALRQIAQASAATALPLVLTLTAAEQRAYAQGAGSPLLNLNGDWSGTTDGSTITWTATQSGNSVTGPFVVDLGGGDTVSGTLNGTISGTVFTFTITVAAGGVSSDAGCSITGGGTSPTTTNNSITASMTLVSSGCVDPIDSPVALSMTKS